MTTKTLRRRLFGLAGRLTRSARRRRSICRRAGPGRTAFDMALARLRAIPLLA